MKRLQLENRTELWNEIPLEAPYCIFIDPSNRCNLQCKFCMNSKIKNKQDMHFDLYKKIIDDLQEFENPVKTIRLYGFGEPLLNKDFPKMVAYAKKSNKVLNVDTTTNGTLLRPTLNKKIIDAGIDRINISISSLNDLGYLGSTGTSINFNALVKNIEHLYSIKEQCTIYIKITGDHLSKKGKKKFFHIFELISDGCDIEFTANCWYDMDIQTNDKGIGIYGQPLEDINVCSYIYYMMTIHTHGECSLCFLDWNKKLLIGDVRHDTIKNIWNGPKMKLFQKKGIMGYKHPICQNCQQLKFGMPVNLDQYRNEILKRIT